MSMDEGVFFAFVGGPECGDVAEVTAYGLRFPKGAPVLVNDERAIRKLRGNQFFAEVPWDDGEPGDVPAPKPEVKRRGRPRRI